jgi:hypothetical protein
MRNFCVCVCFKGLFFHFISSQSSIPYQDLGGIEAMILFKGHLLFSPFLAYFFCLFVYFPVHALPPAMNSGLNGIYRLILDLIEV